MRKEIWSGPALSSGATPVTTRDGSPARVARRATASSPRVNPAALPILLLLALGPGLLVVRADDFVREVRVGRCVEHHRAPLLDDDVVAPLLADPGDDTREALEHGLQQLLLLLLQLLLEVVGQAGRVAALALEHVLLVPPGPGRPQRALFFH